MTFEVNGALTDVMGDNIESIITKLASIQELVDRMNEEFGDGAGDRLTTELYDLVGCLTEALESYFHDAIDAQVLKDNFQKLHASLHSCALCIEDGIEKNYGSWDEWQSIAREVLRDNVPEVAKELDRYEDVIKYDEPVASDGKEVAR